MGISQPGVMTAHCPRNEVEAHLAARVRDLAERVIELPDERRDLRVDRGAGVAASVRRKVHGALRAVDERSLAVDAEVLDAVVAGCDRDGGEPDFFLELLEG